MNKEKEYKDMTVGEGLITALQQAVDYERMLMLLEKDNKFLEKYELVVQT